MGARVWHNDNWSHTHSYYYIRCSSFQKLINRSLRSPSLFLSLTHALCLSFFLHRFPVRLALYLFFSGALSGGPRSPVCLFSCSCSGVLLLPWRRSRQTGFRRALFILLLLLLLYQPTPPPPQIPRIHRRLGISVSLGPGRSSSFASARASSPTNLRIVFHYYYFSLRSEKIARIASRDRLLPSRVGSSAVNKNNIYFLFYNFNYHHWEYYNIYIICVAAVAGHILLYTYTPIVHLPRCSVQRVCRRRLRVDLSSIYRFIWVCGGVVRIKYWRSSRRCLCII